MKTTTNLSRKHELIEGFDSEKLSSFLQYALQNTQWVYVTKHFEEQAKERRVLYPLISELKEGHCFEYYEKKGRIVKACIRTQKEGEKDTIYVIGISWLHKNEYMVKLVTCYKNRRNDHHKNLRSEQYYQ